MNYNKSGYNKSKTIKPNENPTKPTQTKSCMFAFRQQRKFADQKTY